MNNRATVPWALITCTCLVFAASARAGGFDGSGLYIGAGAGRSHASIDDRTAGVNALLLSSGFGSATTTTGKNDKSLAYKAFVGYDFNRYVALELGYFNLGKFKFDTTVAPPGTLHGETTTQGINLDAVFSYPFDNGFSVFGRIGIQQAKSKVELSGTGSVVVLTSRTSESGRGRKSGIGLGYEFAQDIGVRGEWEYYRIPDGTNTDTQAKVDVIGISLYYKF